MIIPAAVSDGVDDVRVRDLQPLTRPANLVDALSSTAAIAGLVRDTRAAIGRILSGADRRLLAIVGPCSVHDVDATLQYAAWLAEMARARRDGLLVVMRVYFEKPRTRAGWKGMINDPYMDGSFRINEGLVRARRLLLEINGMGLPTATEFVDPITPQYIGDLVSWAAIGARTTESPVHRELASGLSCPVGFKNGTNGDVRVAVNAIVAASRPQRFLGVTRSGAAAIVATSGNPDCHLILRGGAAPNYDAAAVAAAVALLAAEHVTARVMVDCSHGNCSGDYRNQLAVARAVAIQRRADDAPICGVMAESNLLPGKQTFALGEPVAPGLSVTDACLGLDDTTLLLDALAGAAW